MNATDEEKKAGNLDPITGAPGAHPVGVAAGAAAGALAVGALSVSALATGAVAGTIAAGPIGTAVGAAIGAVVGGLGGKAVAEHFDPTQEGQHWQTQHAEQAYYAPGEEYDAYEPAYRLGGQDRQKYANRTFEDVEPSLAQDYAAMKGDGHVEWDKAKHAVRAAWDRVSHANS